MKFYDDNLKVWYDLDEMAGIVGNGTTHITIKTPEGWKCERENCLMDYLHKHTTYLTLEGNN